MAAEQPQPSAGVRHLAAIMFTDIVGFSRQMGADESRTLRLLAVHNQLIQQAVTVHDGAVIKTIGDAFLVNFPSVVNAVQCAQQIQAQFKAHNAQKAPPGQIHVRIGIHLGDIVQQDGDVFGDGVNVASRLQGLAEPDTICISQVVYNEVEKKLALGTVMSLGRPKLKNIVQRFPVYALLPDAPSGVRQQLRVHRHQLSRRMHPAYHALAVALLLMGVSIVATHYLLAPTLITLNVPSTPQPALPLPDKPSIAVLPFINMSNAPEQEYFSDGLTETLTGDLSKISSLFVIARNSAFTYKGKAVKVQEVGREMGVRYVLEGSVLKADQQVRINVQLLDAATGYHLWSERYDRPLQNVLQLQDEIVQKIVTTLKLQLTLEERGIIARKHTDNLEAYDAVLRGVEHFWRLTRESDTQARQLFEQARTLDLQYAEAYAWLGWTYWLEWVLRWSADPQTLEQALALAQQALALDDSLPFAHSLLGNVYAWKKQHEQAIAEGEQAISLDPNNADSYTNQAQTLIFAGRPEEALRLVEQAMRLNPRYPPWYSVNLGMAYRFTGRYAEAIATLQDALSRNPNFAAAHLNLAASYRLQWLSQQNTDDQTLEKAVAAAERAVALNASWHWTHIFTGYIALYQGQYEQALAEMERGVGFAPTEAGTYAALAEVLSRMGRAEEALQVAAQAVRLEPEVVDDHFNSIGTAYYLAGQLTEARAAFRRFLSRYPNILGPHLILAAVDSELGQGTEAQAEAAEVLRLNPKFSLEVHRQRMPIKDPAVLDRHLTALRKAGLK